jgi:superoxide dismutase, Cu-Zn family
LPLAGFEINRLCNLTEDQTMLVPFCRVLAGLPLLTFMAFPVPAIAAEKIVPINAISATGVGDKIGDIVITEGAKGLTFKVTASGISDGEHGFHMHEKADCGPGEKDGKPAAGHTGDLPKLSAASKKIDASFEMAGLKIADVTGHAFVIHESGDNYSDTPENGGGAGRIACAAVK